MYLLQTSCDIIAGLAGIGRTGTVVGCYLVRSGMHGAAALCEITRLRRGLPDGKVDMSHPKPLHSGQFVLDWRGYVVRQQNGTSNALYG
ncbi:MAG: hypothetical protein ACLFVO_14840 [Chloroflexaceae bacterium]